MMQFTKSEKSKCRIKLAVQGASGSGKTYSSLLLAYGLTGDWSKVAVVDTENGSANLYADLGGYSVLSLTPPFSPEQYAEAIQLAVKNGFECLVIDSLSHEWNGAGGVLDIHGNTPGNSFTAWAKITPRHNAFLQTLLQADLHVIATMRSKTEYVLQEKNGKQVPEKIGMKAVQREDAEYEFTIVFEINHKHQASVSKDRTGLFRIRPELVLTPEVGKEILNWCKTGKVTAVAQTPWEQSIEDFTAHIHSCKNLNELNQLFLNNPQLHGKHDNDFNQKRAELNKPANFLSNGVHH